MENTQVSLGITLLAVIIGAVMIYRVSRAMKKKQISDYQGLSWILISVIIIILGVFPGLIKSVANVLGIWWAPAVLLFTGLVLVGYICFSLSKEISILKAQVMELTMQLGLAKKELEDMNTDQKISEGEEDNK